MYWRYMYGMDMYYIILVLPAVLVALWAQIRVKSTFAKYSKITGYSGLSAYDVARFVLDSNGLQNVKIERIGGSLTDHFDPKTNVIRLSESVYDNRSAAAIGVAAHEAGHAVQYAVGYTPIKLRAAMVPVCNIGSNLAMPLVILGLVLGVTGLAEIGVLLFSLSTIFQLVTLPVEFNASRRAMVAIENTGRFSAEEIEASRKTLRAAALTYVAALAVSLMNLLRLILIVGGNGRRRD